MNSMFWGLKINNISNSKQLDYCILIFDYFLVIVSCPPIQQAGILVSFIASFHIIVLNKTKQLNYM